MTQAFHGDIEGQGAVEHVMMYRGGTSGNYVSLRRVGGRSRSFVLQRTGSFEAGAAKCS